MHLINGRPEQKRNVTAGVCHSPSEKEVFEMVTSQRKFPLKKCFKYFTWKIKHHEND